LGFLWKIANIGLGCNRAFGKIIELLIRARFDKTIGIADRNKEPARSAECVK